MECPVGHILNNNLLTNTKIIGTTSSRGKGCRDGWHVAGIINVNMVKKAIGRIQFGSNPLHLDQSSSIATGVGIERSLDLGGNVDSLGIVLNAARFNTIHAQFVFGNSIANGNDGSIGPTQVVGIFQPNELPFRRSHWPSTVGMIRGIQYH